MRHLVIPRDLSHWNGKKPQGLQFTNSEYGDRWKHRNPEQYLVTIAGHQQGRQVAYGKKADGTNITCIITGSCYEHQEGYLNVQTNNHWRGLIMLNEVNNGSFDEMFVSLRYLREKYG